MSLSASQFGPPDFEMKGTHRRASAKASTANVRLHITQTLLIVELNRHHGRLALSSPSTPPSGHVVLIEARIDDTEPERALFTEKPLHTSETFPRLQSRASGSFTSVAPSPPRTPLLFSSVGAIA